MRFTHHSHFQSIEQKPASIFIYNWYKTKAEVWKESFDHFSFNQTPPPAPSTHPPPKYTWFLTWGSWWARVLMGFLTPLETTPALPFIMSWPERKKKESHRDMCDCSLLRVTELGVLTDQAKAEAVIWAGSPEPPSSLGQRRQSLQLCFIPLCSLPALSSCPEWCKTSLR